MSKHSELADALIQGPPLPPPSLGVRVEVAYALRELEAEVERHKSNHAEILRQFREATTELARRAAEIERLRALLAEVVGWADRHGEEPWGLEQARAALEGK